KEERGIAPYKLRDMLYFSIVAYTGDNPIALRGKAAKNALWETLSIINWGELDALFIDTPPGIGDEHLEIIYKLRGIITPIIVSNPTSLSLKSTYRLIQILMNANYKKLALLENMGQGTLETLARDLHLIYIGYIPYSSAIEECTGDPTSLLKLDIGSHVELVLKRLLV
ncbi:MAG: P-loop NTPase, partial [Desulfurococcaceae archaeon]